MTSPWNKLLCSVVVWATEVTLIQILHMEQYCWPPRCPVFLLRLVEEWSLMQEEEVQQIRWRRSPRDPNSPRTSRRNRKKTKSSHDCHLERKEMRVRDLGLGYDSDEIILFKYCVGTCHSSRKNYDLALKALIDNGSISEKKVSSHPCCRPTRYETVSFMDTTTTWQTIRWLSAANCSCVGWLQRYVSICSTQTQECVWKSRMHQGLISILGDVTVVQCSVQVLPSTNTWLLLVEVHKPSDRGLQPSAGH